MPLLSAGDNSSPTYRTHRIHRDMQLWFVEGRDFRSPNSMPDGPDKSIWGVAQKQWLMQTLSDSDATWKVIISPTPMVGPDRDSKSDNHTNSKGFRHEADEFFRWLKNNEISNVLVFCGDRHWQYHSVHPSGVQEFGCGALNDENSIPGTRAGTIGSTDPEGLIDQRYLYPEPSGGFLFVEVSRTTNDEPTLSVSLRDDHGNVGYQYDATGK
jgi:alkaline phosphatase/alkaline phosphatase D